jgi:hypothetical protein
MTGKTTQDPAHGTIGKTIQGSAREVFGKSIRGSARTISGRDNIHALFAFGVSVSWLLHSTFFISTIAP